MKLRHIVVAAAWGASLATSPAFAQAVFTEATSTEVFAAPPAEGVVKCRGNVAPTGNFFTPCPAGVGGTIRGRLIYYAESVSIPALNGFTTVVTNINFDADGTGPMWGTFEWVLTQPPGGSFSGTFTGSVNLITGALDVKLVGHGQGDVEGLQVMGNDVHSSYGVPGIVTFRVLNPGGKR